MWSYPRIDRQTKKEEFQDFEASPINGRHVLVKLAQDGHALPEADVNAERQRAGHDLEQAEQDKAATLPGYVTAAIKGSYCGRDAALLVDPAAFLRACEFSDPRYETRDGREWIALDFTPHAGADLPMLLAHVTRLKGTLWIDAADKVLARLEAWNLQPGRDKGGQPLPVNPAPKLVYQQTRLPQGVWFPALIRLNAGGDASAFGGLNWDVVFEFDHYQRFNAVGEQEKLSVPGRKP